VVRYRIRASFRSAASIGAILIVAGLFAVPVRSSPGEAAGRIDAGNLYANERAWPHRTRLAIDWMPPGADGSLRSGTRAVVVRVDGDGTARLDFGRLGRYQVPVGATDLVSRANEIAAGNRSKHQPNFLDVVAARTWKVSPDAPPRPNARLASKRWFVSVFGDSEAESFGSIARAITQAQVPLDVEVIVFAQGAPSDRQVYERLAALEWWVSFSIAHVTPAITRTLFGPETGFPLVAVFSPEGRLALRIDDPAAQGEALTRSLDAFFRASAKAGHEVESEGPTP